MNVRQLAADLTAAYEALRAQATGQLAATTPRGLALLVTHGCAAWMHAWTPLAPMPTKERPAASDPQPRIGIGGEVVQLLAEMALGCQRRWVTG